MFRHVSGWLRGLVGWLGGTDLVVLLCTLVLVGSVLGFIKVADWVQEGETRRLDEWLLRTLRTPTALDHAFGPYWLEDSVVELTALGGPVVLTLVTAVVAGYLILDRKFHALWLLLAAAGGGALLSNFLKRWFGRPRPAVVPHLDRVFSPSFPSGHAMLSAVIYLTLGALLARMVESRRLKVYFVGVGLFVSFLVGTSRVYLGVHYPTDVLAGWSAGLAWALLCDRIALWLQREGAVEGPTVESP
jgi:undecaprenyl-diphosphatase